MSRQQVIDTYFLEHRAKLLDIAGFIDRVDRSDPGIPGNDVRDDHRIAGLKRAMELLIDGHPQRVKRVLELLSDPTISPIESAQGKGASGAYRAPSSDSIPAAGCRDIDTMNDKKLPGGAS